MVQISIVFDEVFEAAHHFHVEFAQLVSGLTSGLYFEQFVVG